VINVQSFMQHCENYMLNEKSKASENQKSVWSVILWHGGRPFINGHIENGLQETNQTSETNCFSRYNSHVSLWQTVFKHSHKPYPQRWDWDSLVVMGQARSGVSASMHSTVARAQWADTLSGCFCNGNRRNCFPAFHLCTSKQLSLRQAFLVSETIYVNLFYSN
jgi:hypothetical protein